MLRSLPFVVSLLLFPALAHAENWPAWRGPTGDGISRDKGFPLTWSASENVKWHTEIPGYGHSSPIVWEDRVFVTTCLVEPRAKNEKPKADGKAKDRALICLDRKTGKILWQKTVVQAPLEGIHDLNSYASSTPATDGKWVFVTFLDNPKVRVAAYDFDGREVWNVSPGEFQSKHGFCSPPVLYKDLVIVNCDQDAPGKKDAYIVAFDKATGKEKYRIDRPNRIRSYTPPLIVEAGGGTQMVLTGCKTTASYDPNDGKKLWQIEGPTEQFVASMIYHKGLFFLTAGFPTYHVQGIKPDLTGISDPNSRIVWHEVKGAGYVPSPVGHGNFVFLVHDNGLATCRDALTGKLMWDERLGKHHSASPVEAEGRIYYIDDDGTTYVVKAEGKFERLAKNILGEEVYSSPAFSNGQIFIRGKKHLWCIEEKK